MFDPQESQIPSTKNAPGKGEQEKARLALQQAFLSNDDLKKAQTFLDAQDDDPRRLLSTRDRQTLKTLDHALLTGDIATYQSTLASISKLPKGRYLMDDSARSLLNAFRNDMESVGLFANVVEGLDNRHRTFSVDLTNFHDNTTLRVYTTGEKIEAKVGNKPVTPTQALQALDGNMVQSIAHPPKPYSDAERALYDKWHQLRGTAKPPQEKTFATADDFSITDTGRGTFTAISDIGDRLSGTVKQENNGDFTYTTEGGTKKITRKPDGAIISTGKDIFGANYVSTLYGSGLKTIEREHGQEEIRLPDGAVINHILIDGKIKVELSVRYAPSEGTLNVGKDGTKEYYFDDGGQTYTIKPNGEVTSKSRIGQKAVTWAPDGSATSMDSYDVTIKDRLTQKGDEYSYSSPDGFQFRRASDWHTEWHGLWPSFPTDHYFVLQNETGTRKMDEKGNVEYTDPTGKKQLYKLSDAARDRYNGDFFVEYKYPDGTAITLSKEGMVYFSIPTKANDIRQHIWLSVTNQGSGEKETKFSPIVYFREAPGHAPPGARPQDDFQLH